jgi:hypothetical protein
MDETSARLKELSEASARAKKQGSARSSLSLSKDRKFSIPFSGVSMKKTFAERKAASDKLENLREEETEALQERKAQKKAKDAAGKKSGGKVKAYAKGGVTRADGCITKGHTKGKMR